MSKVDLKFILADCHGDIEAAQRRIDRALAEAEYRGQILAQEVRKLLPRAPKMNGREDFTNEHHIVARALDKYNGDI